MYGNLQPASRLGRSIVTQVATAQVQVTNSTTAFGSQTRHVRVVHTLSSGIWATIDSTRVDDRQQLRDIFARKLSRIFRMQSGPIAKLSQHQHLDRLCLANRDELMTSDHVRRLYLDLILTRCDAVLSAAR